MYFFFFKNVSKSFFQYIRMESTNHKIENIKRIDLNNTWTNHFFKVKNSLLELEKGFIELKDREPKDREEKLKER